MNAHHSLTNIDFYVECAFVTSFNLCLFYTFTCLLQFVQVACPKVGSLLKMANSTVPVITKNSLELSVKCVENTLREKLSQH